MTTELAAAAVEFGVEARFVDALGREHEATDDAIRAILRGIGVPCADASDVRSEAARLQSVREQRLVDTVSVSWDAARPLIPIRQGGEPASGALRVSVSLESGEVRTVETRIGVVPEGPGLVLPPLPHGRHRVAVEAGTRRDEAWLLVAPLEAPWPLGSARALGLVAPVAGLHSSPTLDVIGDIARLGRLAEWSAGYGVAVIGTLPLLAQAVDAGQSEESPYAPLSRAFFNELHLALADLPEATLAGPAAALRALALEARPAALVDRTEALRVRRPVLEALAAEFLPDGSAEPARRAAFAAYLEQRPDVIDFARFRAARDRSGPLWRGWPHDALETVSEGRVRFHAWCQWALETQLADLRRAMNGRGQLLYLDLPVGSHPDGYDAWRHRDLFANGICQGAPPDALFTEGQNWGFPPTVPAVGRADGHAYLAQCLAAHLRYAGLLRIDHVIGLHRAYWIPEEMSATSGCYVRCPAEEQWAVVCIEAARFGAGVVGENLGTLPPELNDTLDRHGIRGMHIAQFALDAEPSHCPISGAPVRTVTAFGTHDTPTIAGFIEGRDIAIREELGIGDPAAERAERARLRRALERLVPASVEPTLAATRDAVLSYVGASDAELALVAVEDLVLDVEPHNVPGTWRELPNWRRRITLSIEDLDQVGVVLSRVAAHRAHHVPVFQGHSLLSDLDLHLFNEGTHYRLYEKFGAHPVDVDGVGGTHFAVWAPNAARVSVIGSFNGWNPDSHVLAARGSSGVWEGAILGVGHGAIYKYRIEPAGGGAALEKADPFAFQAELPPLTASVVGDLGHDWDDLEWMTNRGPRHRRSAPMSVYELHLGSFMRVPEEGDRMLTYDELAPRIADHVERLGFTHVEVLPVMEHPFGGSWGYQTTGYFSATSRHGDPAGLMRLIDYLHRRGIGVIVDWVPSHFATDAHGLSLFDGTHLYEHEDPRQGFHPDWGSFIFNYARNEVRSFLISSAMFWMERYHVDGLRVDAVASMLYLDYSRREGEWIPNDHGGRENLAAISFMRDLNRELYGRFPEAMSAAEESTAWPGVSRPLEIGGLGFGFKWDMGWMHDTLGYMARDPIHRKHHQRELTFRMLYAWSENYVLPLSHDEVVHGKGSLLGKMPGDEWQAFANLRLLHGLQSGMPGKKLLFMGGEFGQREEWNHDRSLSWHLLEHPSHAGVAAWVSHLNALHRTVPALHELDCEPGGFRWLAADDEAQCVFVWLRFAYDAHDPVVVVANATPVPRPGYRVGVPFGGAWDVVANSDADEFGGSGYGLASIHASEPHGTHGEASSIVLDLPPLALLILRRRPDWNAGS